MEIQILVLESISHYLALSILCSHFPLQPSVCHEQSMSSYYSWLCIFIMSSLTKVRFHYYQPRKGMKSSRPLIQSHFYSSFSRKLTMGLPFSSGDISPLSPSEILWPLQPKQINKQLTVQFPNSGSFSYKWHHM